jgi:hypothetical protein
LILPSVYNGPIIFYALVLYERQEIIIEQYDHYTKQTYRNRCRVAGANGLIDLTVPVVNDHGKKTLMKDTRIDYSTPWQQVHWRTILSSYASSPYFEYTRDLFHLFYESRQYNYLIDLNHSLVETTLDALEITANVSPSSFFSDLLDNDPRERIHPKKRFLSNRYHYEPVKYHQVFQDRHGFQENLSILDLIFNAGMEARTILQQSLEPIKNPDT